MSIFPPFSPIFSSTAAGFFFGSVFVVLVVLACVNDVRSRRIPNNLVAVTALTGIAFSLMRFSPLEGLLLALGGLALGFLIWIGFYAVGVLGAGDVKFFAAAAAWLGPAGAWRASLVAAVAGGLLAVVYLLRESKLKLALHRIALLPLARSIEVRALQDMSKEEARRQLPYGVALGIGVIVVAMFPAVLS